MTREIKFRAWLIKEKSMLDMHDDSWVFRVIKGIPSIVDNARDGDYLWEGEDELVVMQYTGLKDSTGQEIYEGDIVKFCDHYNVDRRVEKSIGVLVFEDTAEFFIKNLKGDYMNLWETVKNYDGKIIGNIYENPKLFDCVNEWMEFPEDPL